MIRTLGVCMFLAGASAGSQIFYMDLPDVLSMADTVLLAKILSVEEIPGQYGIEVRFGLMPLDMEDATEHLDSVFTAAYFMEYPRSYHLDDGTEIWESPLVSGSGMELTCGTGDTVTVLLAYLVPPAGMPVELLRMEPAGSIEDIQGQVADPDSGEE